MRAASLALIARAADDPAQALADAVHERLAPRGAIETELADGIAMALWRLRRAQRLEEELLAPRRDPALEDGLTTTFLRRASGTSPLALLLRYRSQALGELNRLFRLLEAQRDIGKAAALSSPETAAAAAPQPQVLAATPELFTGQPANDNRADDERRGG